MSNRFRVLLLAGLFFSACSTNNVTVDDSLQRYFDSAGVRGDFGLFDNGQGHFTIYNLSRFRDSAYSPGATFDIVQSLIAIQTGVVNADNAVVLEADSTTDSAVTLSRAFRSEGNINALSFRRLADRIGKDTLKKWVDSLHYGNRDLAGYPKDIFWVDGHLRIAADEQLGLIKKLYFDQLPFFQRSQQLVRHMFQEEKNSNYQLVYKTGWTTGTNGQALGWVMGWVEENKHPYFFVLNMESADSTARFDSVGFQLVKRILRPMGFFAGTK